MLEVDAKLDVVDQAYAKLEGAQEAFKHLQRLIFAFNIPYQ
jgi:hypothetical protein